MKHYRELLLAAAFFMALSAIIYLIHYAIFGDDHHIFIFMLSDLAFLPLEVFLVVILIERIISRRETASKLEKMNMVVGAFFSEVGNRLLGDLLPGFDAGQVEQRIAISRDWTPAQFRNAASGALEIGGEVDVGRIDLEKLKDFLLQKRAFLVGLLENPQTAGARPLHRHALAPFPPG